MSSRTCPDWPTLMEIAPDLQFMHYTVAEAQLPVDVLDHDHPRLARRRRDLLRPRQPRLLRRAHRPEVAEALRSTHWFEVHEYVSRTPDAAA